MASSCVPAAAFAGLIFRSELTVTGSRSTHRLRSTAELPAHRNRFHGAILEFVRCDPGIVAEEPQRQSPAARVRECRGAAVRHRRLEHHQIARSDRIRDHREAGQSSVRFL